MSEKDKMQATELAKIMVDAESLGGRATSFMDGYVKGYIDRRREEEVEDLNEKENAG